MAVGQRTSPVSDRASPPAAPLTPDDQGASDPQEATRGVPEQPWFITCVYAHKRRAGSQRLWRNYCSEIPSNNHPLQRIAAPLEGDPQQSGNFRRKAPTCLHFLGPCRSEPDLLPMDGIHSAGGGTQFRRPVRFQSGTAVHSSLLQPRVHLQHLERPHDPQRDQRDPHGDGAEAGGHRRLESHRRGFKLASSPDFSWDWEAWRHHMEPCRPSISSRVRLGNSRPTWELAKPDDTGRERVCHCSGLAQRCEASTRRSVEGPTPSGYSRSSEKKNP